MPDIPVYYLSFVTTTFVSQRLCSLFVKTLLTYPLSRSAVFVKLLGYESL